MHKDDACTFLDRNGHDTGQTERAQTARTVPAHAVSAVTAPWTPQYTSLPGASRPPLALPSCTHHHHPYLYPLDMLDSPRVHPSRRHDRHPAAHVLPALERRQPAIVLPLLQQHARQLRLDDAYALRPLACPFAPWSAMAVDELHGTPAAPRAPIKGDHARTIASHHSLPRSSLSILDHLPSPIKLAVAGISSESAATVARRGRRLRPPQHLCDHPLPRHRLLVRSPASPSPAGAQMEPYVQTETYDLENGGSLVFERDLYLVSERLERPPPKFHGVRIHNTPTGEQQWMITADLKGSSEPPISERILFSFKAYSWVDGLAHALQEGLARVCGQNIAALRGSRFAHFARHDTMGEPMALSSHPVLKIHVQHLDFMLHETRKDLELTRVHSHRAQMALAHHADAIRLLAKDRRSLRLQRAKNVATITRLREKIRTLEVTVRTQQDQIQEMEEDGEDIQGGDDFLSDDNDFEDDEFTDEEDYEFLEAAEDGIIPIDVDEDPEE
ncbi:hypothetical protein QYE76_041770 [Lolium multiflorum]|uniref:Uncharacterized protein n=1 Tax=Lolium multiflorum TaxID=4521 RepID=A0AAD8TFH9_LOLMU|nr:hypothetical protein QYE76_041770 [Lolium multiflorum]